MDVKKLNELPVANSISDTDLFLVGNPTTGALSKVPKTTMANYFATKGYVDSALTGMLQDCGNFDPTTDEYPSDNGSGNGGEIMKGDVFFAEVDGTLSVGNLVLNAGDSLRALVDNAGQNRNNWAVTRGSMLQARWGQIQGTITDQSDLMGLLPKGKFMYAFVSQAGTTAPSLTVMHNGISGYSPTAQYSSAGNFLISLPNIAANKRFVQFSFNQFDNRVNQFFNFTTMSPGSTPALNIIIDGGPFGGNSWLDNCSLLIGDLT